jgi:hypothetical protein
MLIVEDRCHVDVPLYSVKFDSIGLCTYSLRAYAPTYVDSFLLYTSSTLYLSSSLSSGISKGLLSFL